MDSIYITHLRPGAKVTWGKDRFVATTAKTDSSTAETAVSFDGITWYAGSMEPGEWNAIGYTQGLFCCAKKRHRQ